MEYELARLPIRISCVKGISSEKDQITYDSLQELDEGILHLYSMAGWVVRTSVLLPKKDNQLFILEILTLQRDSANPNFRQPIDPEYIQQLQDHRRVRISSIDS